ncbi:MAG: hypothetical protein AAF420_00140 [Pseudomonadota bacterium]
MGTIWLDYKKVDLGRGGYRNALEIDEFKRFNTNLLNLGEVSNDAETINAIAAVYDLEGFTDFCNQLDPQLVVPEYLDAFVGWLFDSVVDEFKKEQVGDDVHLWGSLPFFAKFLGDGVMFLWDSNMIGGQPGVGNVVISLSRICRRYLTEFEPKIQESMTKVPRRLRVGIARGQVLSIGDGQDYVGPCINMASRLQKLGSLTFAVSRRGIDPRKCFSQGVAETLVQKRTRIRGIGESEVVLIFKDEFEMLDPNERARFV